MAESVNQSKFAIFQNADGEPTVAARFENDDVWLTQKHLALLYKTTKQNVSQHIQSIFDSGELSESSCVKKFFTVEEKFGRPAKIPVYHYNLDLIIALGYRIDSPVAIKFRQWATARLHEYIQKGLTLGPPSLVPVFQLPGGARRMKRFLFDTWYGAFSVWGGATTLMLAVCELERLSLVKFPSEVGKWIVFSLLGLLAVSGLLFFVAWIVSLVKRRWKRAVLQAVTGLVWTAGFFAALGAMVLVPMFGPDEDKFADGLTIPPEVEKDILIPEWECKSDWCSTVDVYEDDFARRVFKSLELAGGDDPAVNCDLAGLSGLVHNRRDELLAYLARHPGWWLHEDRGNLCATRRLRVRGVWNHSLHGYYSGYSRQVSPGEDFEAQRKSAYYQTRTTIGFPYSPFGRKKGAEHPATGVVKAELKTGNLGSFGSSMRFGDKDFCVEVFEESTARERRLTKAVLAFLKGEFAGLKLPEDAVKRGADEFILRNGMQPGIYNLTLRLNPGEPGVAYLKAFEVTKGTRLSEARLHDRSNERIGWSKNPDEKFLYENEFTIYEGDWGKPYAARIEVWFRPDSGKPERKLIERVCKVEGWQR